MDTFVDGHMTFFDPDSIHLERTEHGPPSLTVAGESYDHVHIYRAFPLSDEDRYIAFFDTDDAYIGMIENLSEVGGEAQKIIEEELSRRYFTPQILRLERAENSAGRTIMEGDTDRGRMSITFRGIRESIVEIAPDRFMITDEHGNRYEIKDLEKLDRRSRGFIRRMI